MRNAVVVGRRPNKIEPQQKQLHLGDDGPGYFAGNNLPSDLLLDTSKISGTLFPHFTFDSVIEDPRSVGVELRTQYRYNSIRLAFALAYAYSRDDPKKIGDALDAAYPHDSELVGKALSAVYPDNPELVGKVIRDIYGGGSEEYIPTALQGAYLTKPELFGRALFAVYPGSKLEDLYRWLVSSFYHNAPENVVKACRAMTTNFKPEEFKIFLIKIYGRNQEHCKKALQVLYPELSEREIYDLIPSQLTASNFSTESQTVGKAVVESKKNVQADTRWKRGQGSKSRRGDTMVTSAIASQSMNNNNLRHVSTIETVAQVPSTQQEQMFDVFSIPKAHELYEQYKSNLSKLREELVKEFSDKPQIVLHVLIRVHGYDKKELEFALIETYSYFIMESSSHFCDVFFKECTIEHNLIEEKLGSEYAKELFETLQVLQGLHTKFKETGNTAEMRSGLKSKLDGKQPIVVLVLKNARQGRPYSLRLDLQDIYPTNYLEVWEATQRHLDNLLEKLESIFSKQKCDQSNGGGLDCTCC